MLRSLLSWAGAIVTLALAALALVTATYRAEQCFVFTGGGGGCSTVELSLSEMAARFPLQLFAPITLLVVLSLAAFVAAVLAGRSRRSRVIGGGFVATHAMLALPVVPILPEPFYAAVPLLAAAYAGSLRDVLLAAVVAVLAWIAGAVTLETMSRFVPPIYGFLAIAFSYWGFATALGIGAGAIAAALGRRLPMSRALLGVFLTLGAAALIAHVPLEAYIYARGVYVNPAARRIFLVGFWLALPNLVLAPFALRVFLGASWRGAIVGTILAFAGAAVAIALPLAAQAILRQAGG